MRWKFRGYGAVFKAVQAVSGLSPEIHPTGLATD